MIARTVGGRVRLAAEMWRLLRFSVVGLSVTLVYVGGFGLLRWAGLGPAMASAIAFAVAIGWQYLAQGRWTFGTRTRDRGTAQRFAGTIGLGFVATTAIVGWAGPAAGLPDAVNVLLATVWVAAQNYVLMRVWVFRAAVSEAEGRR